MKLTDTEIKTACLDKISGLAASMITEFNKMDLEDEEDLYWFADKGTRMFESISRLSSFSRWQHVSMNTNMSRVSGTHTRILSYARCAGKLLKSFALNCLLARVICNHA